MRFIKMESWNLIITFTILLFGVFFFKKLWLGTLGAVLFFVISKGALLTSIDFIYLPFFSGIVISIELGLLLFGAYLFYNTLHANHHFSDFIKVTSSFPSKLFVIIILCVFMGSFMEGIAGFGIPAMLIAPLLMTLGFKPLTSIVMPLAANTTAVTFGALGTPLKVGLGIYETDSIVASTLVLNSFPALTLPFLLAYIYSKTEQCKIEWGKNWKMLAGAGFSFVIPYLIAGFFSIEYPSVVAGIIGLLLFFSFNVPKSENPSYSFWLKTFYPYLIFTFFLFIAKYILKDFSWILNEGSRPLSFYQPGIIFIISCISYMLFVKKNNVIQQFYIQSRDTLFKIFKSLTAICLLVFLAQLIQDDLSVVFKNYYTDLQPTVKVIVTPFVGVIGSFITGSATMSNILFGSGIRVNEINGSILPILIALLHTGSAIGNAISLQNILMVKSVVNQPLIGYAQIFKFNLFIVGIYSTVIILLSLLIINH
jgi:lactate permease